MVEVKKRRLCLFSKERDLRVEEITAATAATEHTGVPGVHVSMKRPRRVVRDLQVTPGVSADAQAETEEQRQLPRALPEAIAFARALARRNVEELINSRDSEADAAIDAIATAVGRSLAQQHHAARLGQPGAAKPIAADPPTQAGGAPRGSSRRGQG